MRGRLRHVVLVASTGLLVLLARPSDAGVEQPVDHAMSQQPAERERARALEGRQEARPRIRRPRPEPETPPDPQRPPASSDAVASSAAPLIADDGYVEVRLPDGSTRRSRPGSNCGSTIVYPDGRTDTKPCYHIAVQKARLPAPDGASAAWLATHGDSLLEIARKLLGGNAASLDNYLKAMESESPDVYERIRLRTDLISKLMGQ